MIKNGKVVVLSCLMVFVASTFVVAAEDWDELSDDELLLFADEGDRGNAISDPLEPMNRVLYEINDVLYYNFLHPVATGYSAVLPEDIRQCVDNFSINIAAPVRFVNALLQGRFTDSMVVLGRFLLNSTVGVLGLGDPAATEFNLELQKADLGQTLGVYGVGEGFYLYIPLLGPSNIRDTVGFTGDYFVHPYAYGDLDFWDRTIIKTVTVMNKVSLYPDAYGDIQQSSLDPYVAIRHGYTAYRRELILKETRGNE